MGYIAADDGTPTAKGELKAGQQSAPLPAQSAPLPAQGVPAPTLLEGRGPGADAPALPKPFPPGTFVVRVGDAYVFGEESLRPKDGPEDAADVICQDIRHGAVLRTPHGASPVPMPLYVPTTSLTQPEPLFAAVTSGPMHLPDRNASVGPKASRDQTNMALIKSSAGPVYKVRVLEVHGDPRVWERWVRIRYEEVPQKVDGGRVDLGPPPGTASLSESEADFVNRVGRVPPLGGRGFRRYLPSGSFQSMTDLPPELEIKKSTLSVLPARLDTTIKVKHRAGIAAAAGIGPNGKLHVDRRAGIAVQGDMEGEIKVDAYSYVHIMGDLVGTLDLDSYTTVRIDGDVLGTVKVRSYVTLYLGGQFRNPKTGLDCKGSCWSTFYFDGFRAERELAALPATGQITLHVRESDLDPGAHRLSPWREVIVAAAVWAKMR